MSAESGLKTFRDNGGLWDNHRVEDVATPEAWARNPELVLRFYNERLAQLRKAAPNAGHLALKELETKYKVHIITQNVDDLHERAGSSCVVHLHGQLLKCRSTVHESPIYDMPMDGLKLGDKCPAGSQLRPHIVWFGELVPAMDEAIDLVTEADILIIVGTSLSVYPAAGLAEMARNANQKFIVDPEEQGSHRSAEFIHIHERATSGLKKIVGQLLSQPTIRKDFN